MEVSITRSRLGGNVLIPASKSHTIRALLIAALADGESVIANPLESSDTRACIMACNAFGASISERSSGIEGDSEPTTITVGGTAGRFRAPTAPIDVMNSGTTLYLAAGVAALAEGEVRFDGDRQIRARPIQPLLDALAPLGVTCRSLAGNGCAPISIRGPLAGGRTSVLASTSQYLSSLLLACPLAPGDTVIDVPLLNERPYAEMTLRWLDSQGIAYERDGYASFRVRGRQRYRPFSQSIPGDFSSATFFACAAAVTGSSITLLGLDMEDSQGDKAVLAMLEEMGCGVESASDGIRVAGPGAPGARLQRLRGVDLDLNATPDAIPALAMTACFAEGTTRLLNVPQARLKETDRIAVMAEELAKLGAQVEERDDGLVVMGSSQSLHGAVVDGHGDHRVVMSLAVAGLAIEGTTVVTTAEAASVTYPGFFRALDRIRQPQTQVI